MVISYVKIYLSNNLQKYRNKYGWLSTVNATPSTYFFINDTLLSTLILLDIFPLHPTFSLLVPKLVASDPTGKLYVTWQYCYLLYVNCTQVCVLNQAHEIGLCSLLHYFHRNSLGPDFRPLILHNLLNESFERQFRKEEFGCFLISMDLPREESNSAGSKPLW